MPIESHISKISYYCLNLHNSKYIQSNKMLNSKQYTPNIYIYSCDNTFKFKKNEEVSIIKC